MSDRTPAERRADALSAEARKLRSLGTAATRHQRNRLRTIEQVKLPAAWRAVNRMREELR